MIKPSLWSLVTCLRHPMAWRLLPRLFKQRQPLRYLPFFLKNRHEFLAKGGRIDRNFPILGDYAEQAGSARGHYFHQDLLVASLIHEAKPFRHIDVGSRIDGFVGHVASFREIEVLDVRPMESCGHKNIRFLRADLMDESNAPEAIADSVSCLHAIEHFGLGRYTDPIIPDGHLKGFANLVRMLKQDGTLYISFPISAKTHTCFNAHRVFHPKEILSWPTPGCQLKLISFHHVDDAGDLHQHVDLHRKEIGDGYGCGIFVFRKISL